MSRFAFTTNNPSGLIDFDLLPEIVSYVVYQEEVGENGTHHFQGYIETDRSIRYTTLLNQLNWDPTHMEPAKKQPSVNRQYCTKEGRVGGPYEWGTIKQDGNQGARSDLIAVIEAIKDGYSDFQLLNLFPEVMARSRSFVREYRAELNRSLLPRAEFVPRPGWQATLVDDLAGPVNVRQIIWIYDLLGNTGKSTFAKNYRDTETYYVSGGKHSDIYYAYASQKYVFFDMPRSAQEVFPYQCLEKFKDGVIFQSKYESKVLRFPIPHVVVFANYEPDRSQLSRDRWDVRNVGNVIGDGLGLNGFRNLGF